MGRSQKLRTCYIYFSISSHSASGLQKTSGVRRSVYLPRSLSLNTSVTGLGQAPQSNSTRLTSPQAASLQLAKRLRCETSCRRTLYVCHPLFATCKATVCKQITVFYFSPRCETVCTDTCHAMFSSSLRDTLQEMLHRVTRPLATPTMDGILFPNL